MNELVQVTPDEPLVEARARVRRMDRLRDALLGSTAVLVAFGLVLIYSASAIRAEQFGWSFYFVEKQLQWLFIGLVAFAACWFFDYRWLSKLSGPMLIVLGAMLVLVLVPGVGTEVNGARRWFRIGGLSIQPSELAKIGLVVAMAALLARSHEKRLRFWRFLGAILVALGGAGLIAMEPDVGTGVLVATVLALMVFAAGARIGHLLLAFLVTAPPAAALVYHRMPYVFERIYAWLQGESGGKGYHAYISTQAIRAGELTGQGIGRGWAKLGYLPEAHTDFVFAVAAQEYGFIGASLVIGAFGLIALAGLGLVRACPDRFGSLMAFGLTLMLGLQAAFNIAVVTATVPTKGISLPFVSFGGSGLVCSLALMGLLASITRYGCAAERALLSDQAGPSPWRAHLLARLRERVRTA